LSKFFTIQLKQLFVYLIQEKPNKMKTTASIFTKITLGILLAGSMAACNNTKTDEKSAPTTAPAVENKEPYVYYNQDTILNKYEYAKDVQKSLQDKGKSAENDLGARKQALQREITEYQKNVNTLSADQRQTTEQRLGREQQDWQSRSQNAAAEFQNMQATEAGKVFDKLSDQVKSLAKEKGYKLVLSYSRSNPTVIYGDKSLDITTELLKRLNEAYAKDKK